MGLVPCLLEELAGAGMLALPRLAWEQAFLGLGSHLL